MSQISSGCLRPGARVPSENELVESFGISRMTANRALRELTAEGYLARIPGVGTFVREQHARSSLLELRNIAEEIAERGHRYSSHLVRLDEIEAPPSVAIEFDGSAPHRIFHIVIVHEENGVPVQLEDRYVNPAIAPAFLRENFSAVTPTAVLLRTAPVEELEHTVEATLPSTEQQELLAIGDREPCLCLHRRSWSLGKVATVATLIYPASRYALYSRHRTSAHGRITDEVQR
jgi:GntR family histidine utilization transcriptional repressor